MMKNSVRYDARPVYLGVMVAAIAIGFPEMSHAKAGNPVQIGSGFTLDPILDANLRYEYVDQPATDADAVTIRLRSGLELANGGFSFLAEAEGTLAVVDDFNDTIPFNGVEPNSVVPDGQSIELNRLQLQYAAKGLGRITVGRQRINLDDQRFVGGAAWRQNEQTFDAISGEFTPVKAVTIDAAYVTSQRTIFGSEARARTAFDGEFILLGAAAQIGPVKVKGFSYLIDYDADEPVAATSSQTYGVLASGKLKLTSKIALDLRARYAQQKDYTGNPRNFSVEYVDGFIGTSVAGFTLSAGYELLGADGGGNAFQTPLGTLHKFNGWADIFLNTPAGGLEDKYAKIGYKLPVFGGVTALVAYHNFDSDVGGISYGNEWDASAQVKLGPVNALLKYAHYNADRFGTDTEKLWLQLGYNF